MSGNMVEDTIVKVDYEEAKKLADLGAIVQDLGFTMKMTLPPKTGPVALRVRL